jgi:hypothetical protein
MLFYPPINKKGYHMQINSRVNKYKYSITWAIFIIVCLAIGGAFLTNVICGTAGFLLFAIDEHYYSEPDSHLYLYKCMILLLTWAVLAQAVANIFISH